MIHVSLMIFLAGMSYSATPPYTSAIPSRPPKTRLTPAQRRLQTKRLLRKQIEQWRTEAQKIKPQEIEKSLKEKPDLLELEIMVGQDSEEVTKLLLMEMRTRAGRWQKAYVARRLVALLDLAPSDRLNAKNKLLLSAFMAVPDKMRVLPDPSVKFPAPEPKSSAPTEAYLLALRKAKEDAKNRNAEDYQIMMVNRSLEDLEGNFTALLLKDPNPQAYQAVIKKLTRQLRFADSSFLQTVKALEDAELSRMDLRLAKNTRNKLKRLAKTFAKPRQYAVYTEVKKQQFKRSEFAQIELGFREAIQNMLSILTQRIEETYRDEPSRPLQRTPGPDDRTP